MAKKIQLTQGAYATVEDEDYAELNQHRWYLGDTGYAMRTVYVCRVHGKEMKYNVRMHRVILGVSSKEMVDHIDGNKLNNMRSNLRVCSKAQNNRNRVGNTTSNCGYKGVHKRKNGTYRSKIECDGKVYNLGSFTDAADAAVAYNNKALLLFGAFAKLNIIKGE